MPALLADDLLETADDRLPVLRSEIGVEHGAAVELVVLQQLLEVVVWDPQHHLAIHLNKPAIAVVRETFVAAPGRQPDNCTVIEAEVQHRVHHPGHRYASSRAD